MAAWNSNGLTTRSVATITDTVLPTDDVVFYVAPGNKVVSIPAANSPLTQPGKMYIFQHSTTGNVTLTPVAGQIDNAATKVIPGGGTALSCLTIINDGVQWRTLSYS